MLSFSLLAVVNGELTCLFPSGCQYSGVQGRRVDRAGGCLQAWSTTVYLVLKLL